MTVLAIILIIVAVASLLLNGVLASIARGMKRTAARYAEQARTSAMDRDAALKCVDKVQSELAREIASVGTAQKQCDRLQADLNALREKYNALREELAARPGVDVDSRGHEPEQDTTPREADVETDKQPFDGSGKPRKQAKSKRPNKSRPTGSKAQ